MRRPMMLLSVVAVVALAMIVLLPDTNGDRDVMTQLETVKTQLDQVEAGLAPFLLEGKIPPGELFTLPESMVIQYGTDGFFTPAAGPENCPTWDPQYCPPGTWYWTCTWSPDEQKCICMMWLC